MDESNHKSMCNDNLRPRYGLIFATRYYTDNFKKEEGSDNGVEGQDQVNNTYLSELQWSAFCKKLSRRKWTHMWNQTTPASWTFPPTPIESSQKPRIFPTDSSQLVDILHALLDGLPDWGPLGYLFDIIWITDKVPHDVGNMIKGADDGSSVEEAFLPAALYGGLKRSYDWNGAHIQVIQIPPEQSSQPTSLKQENELEDGANFLQQEVGANITAMETFLSTNPCFSSCKAKCSSDRLLWRGSLGFYDEVDSSLCVRRMKGFQLYAKDDKSTDVFNVTHSRKLSEKDGSKNILISRALKMISKCDVSTVPVYLLTSKHFYLTVETENDDEAYEHFLDPEGEYFANLGVIAKMDFILIQGGAKSVKTKNSLLTFDCWKQYITNSHTYEESLDQLGQFESELEHSTLASYISEQSGDSSGQIVESLFFLIMNDIDGGLKGGLPYDNGRHTKLCILLDPSAAEGGGQLKSFNQMQDTCYPPLEEEDSEEIVKDKQKVEDMMKHLSISSNCNIPKLYTFIRQVQSAVLAMIVANEGAESEYLSKDRFQSTLDAIQLRILHKVNAFKLEEGYSLKANDGDDKNNFTYDTTFLEEDDSIWEEKRFLAFMERLKKEKAAKKLPNSDHSTMKPNTGDFVILEAKEMLKRFTSEGLAKNPKDCEEIIVPTGRKKGGFDWDKSAEDWPEIFLADHIDLCYNRNEKSEELDRERAQLQLMYIGNKETASTCHAQNSAKGPPPVVVTKRKKNNLKKEANVNQKVASNSTAPSQSSTTKTDSKSNTRTPNVKGSQYNPPNPTQLRRSPRKKMSTTAVINAAYRTGGGGSKKISVNVLAAEGASSVCSGDTISVISDKRSLPNSIKNDSQQGKDEVVSKTTINERGDTGNSHATRSGRLRGGSEISSGKSNQTQKGTNIDEAFVKKLRNAVYDALIGKNIDKEQKLFRPCFKKLFDICMMYGKDLAKNSRTGTSTSQLLNKIAQQNVDSVINLEKTLFGEDSN